MTTFEDTKIESSGPAFYDSLAASLRSLLSAESDLVAQLANASALIHHHIPNLNWTGFYILRDNTLVVGPFQGKPACTRIKLGQGVCGTAAMQRKTVLVPDVHQFEGHIACDAHSRSEIVLPLISPDGSLRGVLDLDSPQVNRFSDSDAEGLETIRKVLERVIRWT